MIIHLAGSSKNIEKDYTLYRAIIKAITECDSVLSLDWIEHAYHARNSKGKEVNDWKTSLAESFSAISRADLVIIEVSAGEYTQGYETALALQQKKPTLIISRHKASKTPASGLRSRLLTTGYYKNGKQNGPWIYRSKDGKVTEKELYRNGELASKKETEAFFSKNKVQEQHKPAAALNTTATPKPGTANNKKP